ncbi:MAG TPA: CocE/NonD family hydrolase [Candidatus Elarobacter sp.]|nr:CocE/NonD family hydrolase [Candidatus Elarobacter sp.]
MTDPARSAVAEPPMQIDWDVPIPMDDGVVLRADVFRPPGDGRYPVILSYGPYAKGLAFQEGYPSAWNRMAERHPDVTAGSSNRYQNWEVVDPEKWVPDGYACVRVDSRGAGRSPGYLDPWCPRETDDLAQCIEWAGTQPWSSGRVGLNGISYYAMNQWWVASRSPAPPHLTAMCAWEGAADFYRDLTHHGGIVCTFARNWYDMQVKTVQHGVGERGARSPITGEPACGPETLDEATLARNRADFGNEILAHPFDDAYHRSRSAVWENVTVPFLSAANWGGQGLHPRGNFEAFARAASPEKWLEVHGIEHWTEFYTGYGVRLQKQFFAHYLKGEDTLRDWPRVRLQVRHLDRFLERAEDAWPIPRTCWTKLYLDLDARALREEAPAREARVAYEALGDGVTFVGDPLREETEITGPLAARLFVSSSTRDADVFAILRAFAPNGEEVVFQGAIDPHTPLAQGWLRASHRALDPALSTEYRPYHTHAAAEPLTPGQPVQLDVELWPTSIVLPAGYRVAFTVRGSDYVYPGASGGRLSNFKNEMTGCGPFLHDDPEDRPPEIFGGTNALHASAGEPPYVLLPVIPARTG